MVYIVVLLYIIVCVFIFDIRKRINGKNANYSIILGLLILISGLSYRLGSDVIVYMDDFKAAKTLSNASISYFFSLDRGHLPGWMFLVSLSKTLCNHFNFLKIIIASFVNYVFFYSIRRYTKYIFTSVLFYYVFLYFIINFEVLRFSISTAIFLLSLKYLEKGNLLKYFSLVIIALLFHEGAFLLFAVPLLRNIKITKLKCCFFLFIFVMALLSSNFLYDKIGLLSLIGIFEYKVNLYMNAEGVFAAYDGLSIFMIVKMILFYGLPLLLLPLVSKSIGNIYIPYFLMFLVCIVLGFVLPIANRFTVFFSLFYYIYIIDLVIVWSKKYLSKPLKHVFVFSILSILLVNRIYSEVSPCDSFYGMSSFTRYYPYASIIEPKIDTNRENLYYYLSTYGF